MSTPTHKNLETVLRDFLTNTSTKVFGTDTSPMVHAALMRLAQTAAPSEVRYYLLAFFKNYVDAQVDNYSADLKEVTKCLPLDARAIYWISTCYPHVLRELSKSEVCFHFNDDIVVTMKLDSSADKFVTSLVYSKPVPSQLVREIAELDAEIRKLPTYRDEVDMLSTATTVLLYKLFTDCSHWLELYTPGTNLERDTPVQSPATSYVPPDIRDIDVSEFI